MRRSVIAAVSRSVTRHVVVSPLVVSTSGSIPTFASLVLLEWIVTGIRSLLVLPVTLHLLHPTSVHLVVVRVQMTLSLFSTLRVDLSVQVRSTPVPI